MWLSGWLIRIADIPLARTRRRTVSPSAALVEQLEQRTLLSVTSLFDSETAELAVSFDHDDTQIVIQADSLTGDVLINGESAGVSTADVHSIDIRLDPNATSGPGVPEHVGRRIELSGVTRDTFPNLDSIRIEAGHGNDTIIGSQLDDSILGQDGDDVINGRGGDDTLEGGAGKDRLIGGAGSDHLDGGHGDDLLRGNAGGDRLGGGDDDDRLFGGHGRDALLGDAGDDLARGGPGDDLVDGGDGWDRISESGDNDFTLSDSQLEGQGRDRLARIEAAVIRGGRGANRLDLSAFSGKTTIHGAGGDDTLAGGNADDLVLAGGGDDSLIGNNGNDTLDGGRGNDWIAGHLGHDRLNGRGGADTLIGGDGDDVLFGGAGHDVALGQNGRDRVFGQGGRFDTISGGNGLDRVFGTPPEINEQFVINLSARLPEWTFHEEVAHTNDSEAVAAYRQRLATMLIDDAVDGWQDLFGQPVMHLNWWMVAWDTLEPRTTATLQQGLDFSDTNTQEEGVDETDIVKSDGEYLYITGDRWGSQQLTIVDTWPAEELHVVAQIDLDGRPVAQYLDGDRLTVVTQEDGWIHRDTPALNLQFRVGQPRVTLTTFDLVDRSTPVVVRQLVADGRYLDSRAEDGFVNLVLQNRLPDLIRPSVICDDGTTDTADRLAVVDESLTTDCQYIGEDAYRVEMTEYFESYLHVPRVFGVGNTGGEPVQEIGPLGDAESLGDVFAFQTRPQLTTVVSFDLTGNSAASTDAISMAGGRSTTVYAAPGSVYLVTPPIWSSNSSWRPLSRHGGSTEVASSEITKLSVSQGDLDLLATGVVPGRVNDRFSLDEHDGYLRVATTTDTTSGMTNNLYVMDHADDQLNIVGQLEGLAPSEKIYSARFMDETAFLVTFRRIDPLFAIDLSDPTAPRVAGELKVTGFSDYLQPINDTHLLGIGREADPETGQVGELQISLFDVSDLSNPTLIDRYNFPAHETINSEARFDPHAVSWFPETSTLAFPVQRNSWWWNGSSAGSALQVFEVDLEQGFQWQGEVPFQSSVRRSLRIGEFLYAISNHGIKVTTLNDPDTVIAKIEYRDQADTGPRPAPMTRMILFARVDPASTMMPITTGALVDPAFVDVDAWIDSV